MITEPFVFYGSLFFIFLFLGWGGVCGCKSFMEVRCIRTLHVMLNISYWPVHCYTIIAGFRWNQHDSSGKTQNTLCIWTPEGWNGENTLMGCWWFQRNYGYFIIYVSPQTIACLVLLFFSWQKWERGLPISLCFDILQHELCNVLKVWISYTFFFASPCQSYPKTIYMLRLWWGMDAPRPMIFSSTSSPLNFQFASWVLSRFKNLLRVGSFN